MVFQVKSRIIFPFQAKKLSKTFEYSIIKNIKKCDGWLYLIYVFPPVFVISSFNFRLCVFNFVPDTLECVNARFNFDFGRSTLKDCHSVSCFVTCFRQVQFKCVGHSSWARDSKNNIVYWHSFSSKLQSNSSPRCKGQITLDEFEWQNTEFVWRNDEFDPTFLTRLATQTNLSDDIDEF